MSISEEDFVLLNRAIDNNISATEHKQLIARLESEPQLAKQWNNLNTLQQELLSGISKIDSQPLPAHLDSILSGSVPNSHNKPKGVVHYPKKSLKTPNFLSYSAIAASILVVAIIAIFRNDPRSDLQALSNMVAGDDSGVIRELSAFVRTDNVLCKHYLNTTLNVQGVACLNGQLWKSEIMVEENGKLTSNGGNYQTASADDYTEIAQYIQQHIQGNILSQKQEQAIMAQQLR